MWLATAYRKKPIPKPMLFIPVESVGKYHLHLPEGSITFCLDSNFLTKVIKKMRIPIPYKGGNIKLFEFCPVYEHLISVQQKVLGYGEILYCKEINWIYVGDGYSFGGIAVREN